MAARTGQVGVLPGAARAPLGEGGAPGGCVGGGGSGRRLAAIAAAAAAQAAPAACLERAQRLHARLLQPMSECAAGDAAHKSDVAAKKKLAHAIDMHGRR